MLRIISKYMWVDMKFLSFQHFGRASYGFLEGEFVFDLGAAGSNLQPDLKSFITNNFPNLGSVGRSFEQIPVSEIGFLPVILNPGKVICVATNYYEKSNENKPVPKFPLIFTRFAEAQTGHAEPILKPEVSEEYDFEGELAVIIGKAGHKISKEQAMGHVAGYSCFNDGSVRDWQKHSSQFTPGKNFFKSAGFGPWMICTSELLDPHQLDLETRVNGVVKQAINTRKMIFNIQFLINYISSFTPLVPGDVIVTGTPSGFGATRNPKEFLSVGDVVEVEISEIGTLRNKVTEGD